MKATLTFDDRQELQLALDAPRMHAVLWNFVERWLREKAVEQQHDFEDAQHALDATWDEINRLLEEYMVDLYD